MSNVESPQHYTSGYIEVIYAIHDVLGREGFKAFCMGNYIKYNARANHKGLRAEDLAKADQYLEWATNGLPDPVDGRVPRKPDIYERFPEARATPTPMQAGEAIHEAAERAVGSPAALGAGYGAGTDKQAALTGGPTAKSVANAIGPVLVNHLGPDIMDKVRLRVTKNQCKEHAHHVWFTAYIYDREDDDEISRAAILSGEPDEDVCTFVGQQFVADITHYFS